MKPQIYNRQELVNRDVEKATQKIKEQYINIMDSATLFWYARHQSYIVTGDVHGRFAAGQVLSSLDIIKEQMQEI